MTSVYYQNVRGLRTKTHDLHKSSAINNYKIICLSETWLNNSFYDSEILHDDYTIFRKDRLYSLSSTGRGGGCLIAVRKNMTAQRMQEFETQLDFLEDVWIRILLPGNKWLYICSVYISPFHNNYYLYDTFLNKVMDNCANMESNDSLMIIGDFNCTDYSAVVRLHDSNVTNINRSTELLINSMDFGNLSQYNNIIINRDGVGNLLDLVFSNVPVSVKQASAHLVSPDKYHPPIEIAIDKNPMLTNNVTVFKNFRKSNFVAINELLMSHDWDSLLDCGVENATSTFYSILNDAINKHVPKFNARKKFPEWFTLELIKLINEKERRRKKFKKYGGVHYYQEFAKLRAECKSMASSCYKKYLADLQESIPSNIKKFWAFSRKKKQSNTYPASMTDGISSSVNSTGICNMFASFFERSSRSTHHSTPPQYSSMASCPISLDSITINENEVFNSISKIDINKRGGPDGVPNVFLKGCAIGLSKPLSMLFNKSLENGICPSAWKSSSLTPIFKSGNKNDIHNYRPIAKQNSFMKLFESIIHKSLAGHVNNLISKFQHGFMPNRSIITNLTLYTGYLASALEGSKEVHAIYLDFSKAFDSVNINKLLMKLRKYGIGGMLLEWLRSSLTNRKLTVHFNGSTSREFSPDMGVPQGSILGPLLFLIFINDIGNNLSSKILLFADDVKLYRTVTSLEDCISLQIDLDRIAEWCEANVLYLNIDKCRFISFSNKTHKIQYVYKLNTINLNKTESIKDLGVTFDSKLTSKAHIQTIVSKAYRNLGFVMRITKDFSNVNCIKYLYSALVRNGLEFACQIWSPFHSTWSSEIGRIQKKFTRFLYFKLAKSPQPYVCRLDELKLQCLKMRRAVADQILLYKIVNAQLDCGLIELVEYHTPVTRLRNSHFFRVVNSRTSYGQSIHPLNRLQRIFNNAINNGNLFKLPIRQFKRETIDSLSNYAPVLAAF